MPDQINPWLLVAGIAGPFIFVVGFTGLGLIRADYKPRYTFASQLALNGEGWLWQRGWVWQVLNCLAGVLIAIFGFGLRGTPDVASSWGGCALIVGGAGMVIFGIFRDDPWLLYPPKEAPPWLGLPRSASAGAHQVGALLAGAGLLSAHLVFAWLFAAEGEAWWYVYSVATAIAFPVLYVSAIASGFVSGLASGRPVDRFGGNAGLLQKAAMTTSLLWVFLLALRLLVEQLARG